MNTAAQVSQMFASTSAGRSAGQPPLAANRAEDLYATWKSVFERARAVEVSDDKPHQPGLRGLQRERTGGDNSRDALQVAGADIATCDEGVAIPATSGGLTIANVRANDSSASPRPVTVQRDAGVGVGAMTEVMTSLPTHAAHVPVRSAGPASERMAPDEGAASPRTQASWRTATAVLQPVSSESVSVFVNAAAVAIVVRDTAISEHEALHCAFETARQLAGERSALQQLILNGRILYQQRCESDAHGSQPSRSLVFAC